MYTTLRSPLKTKSGFSLLEISISLTILAVLLAAGLSVFSGHDDSKRYKQTSERMNRIQAALATYVNTNHSLPCPAYGNTAENGTYSNGMPSFGVATTYSSTAHSCSSPDAAFPLTPAIDGAGMVPTYALNLDNSDAYDGWNHKFTYRIAKGMGPNDFMDSTYMGDISIIDINGVEKTDINKPVPHNEGAAYVLISYGPDGLGAWLRNTTGTMPAATGREIENTDHAVNKTYIQNDRVNNASIAGTTQASGFDDIVVYARKSDLLPASVIQPPLRISSTTCTDAWAIALDSTGNTTTTIFTNPSSNFTTASPNYPAVVTQIVQSAKAVNTLCNNQPSACGLSPLSIEPNNLQLWLDATDPYGSGNLPASGTQILNSTAFTAWKDKSGNGFDATVPATPASATGPKFLTNQLGGNPVMQFAGSNQLYIGSVMSQISTAATIFVVAYTSTTGTMPILNATNTTSAQEFSVQIIGNPLLPNQVTWSEGPTGSLNTLGPVQLPAAISMSVYDFLSTGTTPNMNIYDASASIPTTTSPETSLASSPPLPTALSFSTNNSPLNIGYDGSTYFTGSIAEIIIYNVQLTNAERRAIETYLNMKWKLTPASPDLGTCPQQYMIN